MEWFGLSIHLTTLKPGPIASTAIFQSLLGHFTADKYRRTADSCLSNLYRLTTTYPAARVIARPPPPPLAARVPAVTDDHRLNRSAVLRIFIRTARNCRAPAESPFIFGFARSARAREVRSCSGLAARLTFYLGGAWSGSLGLRSGG